MKKILPLILLLTTACATTSPVLAPQVGTPAGWSEPATADAAAVSADWWQRFGSAELQTLVDEALAGTIERALALSPGEELGPEALALHRIAPEEEEEQSEKEAQAPKPERIEEPLPTYLDRLEREAILQALGNTGFNRTAAARLLGITFRQLRYRMQRLNIKDENR